MMHKVMQWVMTRLVNNEKYVKLLRKSGVRIGEGCVVNKSVIFGTEPYLVKIGNFVRLTHGVEFVTHDGGLWVLRNLGMIGAEDKMGNIVVGDNCNIGWHAIIMPGVHIGNNCIIGAGAIVTKDIPDNSVAVGIPAKVIESIEEYCNKNKSRLLPTKNMNQVEKRIYLEKIFWDNH